MMYVYASRRKNAMGQKTPIVVETNLQWALPYWEARKRNNPQIHWEIR